MNLEDDELLAYMDAREVGNFRGVKKELGDSFVIYWFVWEKGRHI